MATIHLNPTKMTKLGARVYQLVNENGEPIENASVINIGETKVIFTDEPYEIRYIEIAITENGLWWKGGELCLINGN